MNILVTGATGFIGANLCLSLLKKGFNVRCAVRDERQSIKIASQFEVVEVGDICEVTNWEKALDSIDVVIHLAACVHQLAISQEALLSQLESINVEGTDALVQQAIKSSVKRFIFISSIKVHAESSYEGSVLTEKDEVGVNCDAYGLSKFNAELNLRKVTQQEAMDFVIIRPPLVYGPHVKANFNMLMRLLVTGIPLPFKGIRNKRSMIAVDNLVDFIGYCCEKKQASNEVYLISDGKDLSLVQLIHLIRNSMKLSPRLFYLPKVFLNIFALLTGKKRDLNKLTGTLRLNPSKAYEQLEWKPVVSVEKAIQSTVDTFLKSKE